jgi:serine/threonine protein kinase
VFEKVDGPGTLKDVCKISQVAYFFTPTNPSIMPFEKSSEKITLNVFFEQLLSCLAVPHSLDIVHRDIKPENVILDYKTTTFRLLDYGSAASLGNR